MDNWEMPFLKPFIRWSVFLGIGLKILKMFVLSRTSLYVIGVHALANELFNYISVVVTSFLQLF